MPKNLKHDMKKRYIPSNVLCSKTFAWDILRSTEFVFQNVSKISHGSAILLLPRNRTANRNYDTMGVKVKVDTATLHPSNTYSTQKITT
jgi:hypothetical protein